MDNRNARMSRTRSNAMVDAGVRRGSEMVNASTSTSANTVENGRSKWRGKTIDGRGSGSIRSHKFRGRDENQAFRHILYHLRP